MIGQIIQLAGVVIAVTGGARALGANYRSHAVPA